MFFEEGFAIYRGARLHMAMTSQCHSPVHKLEDELAFCLSVDSVNIVDEPSASWAAEQYGLFYKAQKHSTMLLSGIARKPVSWLPHDPMSRVFDLSDRGQGSAFGGMHARYAGFLLARFFHIQEDNAEGWRLLMLDATLPLASQRTPQITHRFILGPQIDCLPDSAGALFLKDGQPLCRMDAQAEKGFTCELGKADYCGADRRRIIRTGRLDIISNSPTITVTFHSRCGDKLK